MRSRVVSFKTHRPNNRELMKSLALANLDEDIPMTGSNNNSRKGVFRGKENKNRKWNREWTRPNMRGCTGPKNGRSPLPLAEGNWYRVIIPYGHKYDKKYVLRTLLNYMAPEVFTPIMVSNRLFFFIYIDNSRNIILLGYSLISKNSLSAKLTLLFTV